MQKDLIIVILLIALVALGIFTYNLYSKASQCQTIATDLGTQLQELGIAAQQCQDGLTQCLDGATQCQDALISLQEACAPYLSGQ